MSIAIDKDQLQRQLQEVEGELARVDEEMEALIVRQEQLESEKGYIISQIEQAEMAAEPIVEYDKEEGFPWSDQARELALSHWGIRSWRGVQRPVINAAMLGKDIIAILPTGGGKSLCYQLPAILAPEGQVTLVVSPLISLIHDQVYHLSRARINAMALSASSSKEEVANATAILAKGASRTPSASSDNSMGPVRLIYVTPERIAKSKRFIGALEKCYRSGRLGRIVVDECHCCSQLGHDFRPDYKKLGLLRTLFPSTPIMALSATCPPSVMESVVEVLGIRSPGKPKGALLFTMPLYRSNLHYGVLAKPASASEVIRSVGQWILEHWPQDRGIVYCMTRREVDGVSQGLRGMGIPVGSYYSDVDDDAGKALSHASWRQGNIRVMVATTAFGMGIDQPNVRYVLHLSPSKSLDGYYQETGRGGRDGLKTDCILWYHPRDQSRLSSLGITDHEGIRHAYAMIRYAEEGAVCRKCLFDQYFQHPTSKQDGDTQGQCSEGSGVPCGHCDVCTRNQLSETMGGGGGGEGGVKEVWEEARMLCKVAQLCREDEESSGRVTALKLVKLWKRSERGRPAVDMGHEEKSWTPPGRAWTIEVSLLDAVPSRNGKEEGGVKERRRDDTVELACHPTHQTDQSTH